MYPPKAPSPITTPSIYVLAVAPRNTGWTSLHCPTTSCWGHHGYADTTPHSTFGKESSLSSQTTADTAVAITAKRSRSTVSPNQYDEWSGQRETHKNVQT